MNEKDKLRLQHMLDAAYKVQNYVRGKTRDMLDADDELLGFAVVRAIEIIGEAANNVSAETQATYPELEWKDIIGLRHLVVHHYFKVDLDSVWNIAQEDIPELIRQLNTILTELPSNSD